MGRGHYQQVASHQAGIFLHCPSKAIVFQTIVAIVIYCLAKIVCQSSLVHTTKILARASQDFEQDCMPFENKISPLDDLGFPLCFCAIFICLALLLLGPLKIFEIRNWLVVPNYLKVLWRHGVIQLTRGGAQCGQGLHPATVASRPGLRSQLVNLLLRSYRLVLKHHFTFTFHLSANLFLKFKNLQPRIENGPDPLTAAPYTPQYTKYLCFSFQLVCKEALKASVSSDTSLQAVH